MRKDKSGQEQAQAQAQEQEQEQEQALAPVATCTPCARDPSTPLRPVGSRATTLVLGREVLM